MRGEASWGTKGGEQTCEEEVEAYDYEEGC